MPDIAKKDRIDMFATVSLVSFAMLLGLNQVLVKLVNGGLHPMFQAGLRSLCALPLVWLYCVIAKKRMTLTDGSFWPGVLCGVFFAAEFVLLFSALDFTSVARASIFFYTMPIWVALAAHFLMPSERLNFAKILGLGLAFGGVVLAFADNLATAGAAEAESKAWLGDVMCLIAAMCWAAIALFARLTKLANSNPEMQLVYQLAVSAPLILFFCLFIDAPIRDLQVWHWGIFAFQVIVLVSFGFAFWFFLLSIYPASDMASFGRECQREPSGGFGFGRSGNRLGQSQERSIAKIAKGAKIAKRDGLKRLSKKRVFDSDYSIGNGFRL